MNNLNDEARCRYFSELALRLGKEGIETENRDSRSLRIHHGGTPICDVKFSGDVFRSVDYPKNPKAEVLFHRTAQIATWSRNI